MLLEPEEGPALHEGVLVGKRFRLERLLGRGATGSVWLATHVALSSPIAIKFLDRSKVIDPDEMDVRLDRFRFEAQISARLASTTSHTVAVHDAGVYRDIPYLVMEYAPGRTLDDMLAERGPLTPQDIGRFLPQIAEALDAAHSLGIIHRDVKLANVLSVEREDGRTTYKLADFGVARMSGHKEIGLLGPRKTAEGLIVGTPAYMSPEQIGGLEDYGPSVDLWALGVVAYETLTGQLPFNSVSLTELAMEISARPHKPPSSIKPGLGRFDDFFTKALAKTPEERFQTAGDMASAFAVCAEDTGDHPMAHEAPIVKRRVGWLSFVAIGAALSLLVVATFFWSRNSTAAQPARRSEFAAIPVLQAPTAPAPVVTAIATAPVTASAKASASPHVASAPTSKPAAPPTTAPVTQPATTHATTTARPFDQSAVH